jgi:hypothetical protein
VAVVETPHFGITDASGLVRIDVPAGEHRVRAWRPVEGERAPVAERLLRASGATATVRLPDLP